MAWLQAVPRSENKRAALSSAPAEQRLSRLKQMQKDGIEPATPPVQAEYMVDMFFDVGPSMPSGFGAVPLSFTEIYSWSKLMNANVSSWEARTLRRLSVEYIDQAHLAEKESCPAPYVEKLKQDSRDAVASKIRNIMSSFRPKGSKEPRQRRAQRNS